MSNSLLREKVERELRRYEHLLVQFSVEEGSGGLELVMTLKEPVEGAHIYRALLHPRDIQHSQFPWAFQKYLYDCLHDYLVEMFTRNPQMREDT